MPAALFHINFWGGLPGEVEHEEPGARPGIFPVGPPVRVVDRSFPEEVRQRAIDHEAKRLRKVIQQREQIVAERIEAIHELLEDAREETEDAERLRRQANAELLMLQEQQGQIVQDRSAVYRMQNRQRLERARERKKALELERDRQKKKMLKNLRRRK